MTLEKLLNLLKNIAVAIAIGFGITTMFVLVCVMVINFSLWLFDKGLWAWIIAFTGTFFSYQILLQLLDDEKLN